MKNENEQYRRRQDSLSILDGYKKRDANVGSHSEYLRHWEANDLLGSEDKVWMVSS